jgi:hypothetical protein
VEGFKGVFAIFPSETMYTSVLCGSLSLIVSAAVNHNDIADLLSDAVASIAGKAGRAANLLLIYPENATLRRMFAGLYAHIFLFYRDTIEWYTQSKLTRSFKSFDARLKERYAKATGKIDDCLVEIYRVAGAAQAIETCLKSDFLEEKIDLMRQQLSTVTDQLLAGQAAQRTLQSMMESAYVEATVKRDVIPSSRQIARAATSAVVGGHMDRAAARVFSTALKPYVVGTEGPRMFRDGNFWLPDITVSPKLSEWISPETRLSTLWVSSPALLEEFPSSRAAALVAAVAAWDSNLPVISHFCERPRSSGVTSKRTIEDISMLGLVYSLIIQLLQFNVEGDTFVTSQESLEALDGTDGSWVAAVSVLRDLLRATPQLERCLIDGLNNLCFSDGAKRCSAFLKMLFEHQEASAQKFKILLTTVGQSRVLPDYVGPRNRIEVEGGAREIVRGGRWLDSSKKSGV